MIRELVELASRVAELERRFAGVMRHGTVAQVDAEKQAVRLKLGQDASGAPFLSPWVPYAQIAGALKVHTPPSVGQQFTLMAPAGDWQQAVAVPMTWSDANPSPSQQGDENVVTYGNVTATIKDGLVKVQVGGTALEITAAHLKVTRGGVAHKIDASGVTTTGGAIEHNGRNVGSTHRHGDVESGNDLTGIPEP